MNKRRREIYKWKQTQQCCGGLYHGIALFIGFAWLYAGFTNTSEHPLALLATLPIIALGLWMVIASLISTSEITGRAKQMKRMRERKGKDGFGRPV